MGNDTVVPFAHEECGSSACPGATAGGCSLLRAARGRARPQRSCPRREPSAHRRERRACRRAPPRRLRAAAKRVNVSTVAANANASPDPRPPPAQRPNVPRSRLSRRLQSALVAPSARKRRTNTTARDPERRRRPRRRATAPRDRGVRQVLRWTPELRAARPGRRPPRRGRRRRRWPHFVTAGEPTRATDSSTRRSPSTRARPLLPQRSSWALAGRPQPAPHARRTLQGSWTDGRTSASSSTSRVQSGDRPRHRGLHVETTLDMARVRRRPTARRGTRLLQGSRPEPGPHLRGSARRHCVSGRRRPPVALGAGGGAGNEAGASRHRLGDAPDRRGVGRTFARGRILHRGAAEEGVWDGEADAVRRSSPHHARIGENMAKSAAGCTARARHRGVEATRADRVAHHEARDRPRGHGRERATSSWTRSHPPWRCRDDAPSTASLAVLALPRSPSGLGGRPRAGVFTSVLTPHDWGDRHLVKMNLLGIGFI